MVHVRRKFVDVFHAEGSLIAEAAIKRIAGLYAVEKQGRGQPPDERVRLRQIRAKPIVDDLESWLHAQLPKISGKSELAKAIRYALARMRKLRPYLEHGCLEADVRTGGVSCSRACWSVACAAVASRSWPRTPTAAPP